MSDSTFEYPRDDFGIPVEVGVETFTGVDAIVVVHQQDSVGVRRKIEVARDGEGLAGIEPLAPEDVPLGTRDDLPLGTRDDLPLGTRDDLPRRHGPDEWLAHRRLRSGPPDPAGTTVTSPTLFRCAIGAGASIEKVDRVRNHQAEDDDRQQRL